LVCKKSGNSAGCLFGHGLKRFVRGPFETAVQKVDANHSNRCDWQQPGYGDDQRESRRDSPAIHGATSHSGSDSSMS
jgi:hypothetical protein